MRSDFFALEPEGQGEPSELERLPWQCLHCAHVRIPQDVDKPRAFRAMATHMLTCAQGLELPQYGRRCPGFTRAKMTKGNERPQQATNGLPSSADCCTMGAPKNSTRLHKGLSDFPRAGRTLVTAFADFTCRFFGQVFSHIGQICNVRGPARARRSRTDRGALQICPFYFPKQYEVFNV